jgi:tetratricopeptide (TPR) repeat protein
MYLRALAGYEKALGPDHASTLDIVNYLGVLYCNQGKLAEAEQMYVRALAGKEKALGPDHTSTLYTVNNLGLLYRDQGKRKLAEAEQMYQRALIGLQNSLGSEHPNTMIVMKNMKALNLGNSTEAAERAHLIAPGPTGKVQRKRWWKFKK